MTVDNSKKRPPVTAAACEGLNRSRRDGVPFATTASCVKLVVSGRLAYEVRSSDLVLTSMTRVCAAGAGETGPARRRANAHPAGHDGTLTRSCTHRREARRAQEKRKAPAKGGQLTTTAYVSVQDLRRIGVAAGKAKTLDPSPLMRTTPWALR